VATISLSRTSPIWSRAGPVDVSPSRKPRLEQGGDHWDLVRRPLLGQEHAVDRLLQFGTRSQIRDAVVAERSPQPRLERRRQLLLSDVEGVQERMEVLLRTVDALVGVFFLHRRPVAGQLAQVGKCGEKPELLAPQFGGVHGSSLRSAEYSVTSVRARWALTS